MEEKPLGPAHEKVVLGVEELPVMLMLVVLQLRVPPVVEICGGAMLLDTAVVAVAMQPLPRLVTVTV